MRPAGALELLVDEFALWMAPWIGVPLFAWDSTFARRSRILGGKWWR
jgi:hypothetical protein